MQLSGYLVATVLGGAALTAPAPGALACSIAISTGGALGLSGDAQRLGSQEIGGLSAVLLLAGPVIGSDTVTISAPTLSQAPGGYNPASQTLEVAYEGQGLLSGVSRGYDTTQSSFNLPGLLGSVLLTVNNRVTQTNGFNQGTYQMTTVVTCS